MRIPTWSGAFALSALLLGAGKQSHTVTEAAPLLVRGLMSPGVPESVPGPDLRVTEARPPAVDTEPDLRRADSIVASPEDLEVLARIVNGECPSDTPFEGKVAVAAVVLNRVRSRRFPTSIPGVAHQRKQFSCYNPSNRARLYCASIPPVAWQAARAALDGQDPTGGCTFFFNPYLVQPVWARQLEFVKRIGTAPGNTHAFYRDRVPGGR